jgi:hypothetical protein
MFKITLSPQAGTRNTQISAVDSVLTIDGVDVDFSGIEDGGSAQGSDKIIGTVRNFDGVYYLTVLYQYDMNTAELQQSADPLDYIVQLISGEIESPITQKEVTQNDEQLQKETDNEEAEAEAQAEAQEVGV